MTRKLWPIALLLALTACHSSAPMEPDPAAQTSDLTAEQLIEKFIAARGGQEKLAGIQVVKMTGTFSTGQTSPSPVTVTIAPGHYLRRIEQGSGSASIKGVNRESAWQSNAQSGKTEAMPPKDAARFRRLADPQGPLFDHQGKGNKVEVIGKLPWRETQVYKLKVTFRDGGVNHIYLDEKSFLPVRVVTTLYVAQADADIDLELLYEDYRDVEGVKWPFKETANAPEAGFTQTISWDKIEVNRQPLDESMFTAPKA